MENPLILPDFVSITVGLAVFLMGMQLNARVRVLYRLNIPDPVTGGLLAALAVLAVYLISGQKIRFSMQGRDLFLVLFFTGIGLNVRFRDLLEGGRLLIVLPLLCLLIIVVQNAIGIGGATFFGLEGRGGVLLGSAALIGGHGTAIAWAPMVGTVTGLEGATELGVAVATLGLVVAALTGGPVAGYLIRRHDLHPTRPDEQHTVGLAQNDTDRPITAPDLMRVFLHLNVAIILGYIAHSMIDAAGLKLPLFVPCLIMGIVIANLRSWLLPHAAPVARTPSLAVTSEFALGTFLAMSLMGMQLWTLSGLGLTILGTLTAQTVFAVLFVLYVLFPLLGRGYRAAVLAAGFGGFALGATPTAIANMTAVTKRYGPSPIAFVVLPLVSAFFVDIANAVVIQTIVNF